MNDEVFYAEVARELQEKPPIPGLWAKCYAECNGDEPKAKAMYLRLRADQLIAQSQEAVARQFAQRAEEERNAEAAQRELIAAQAKLEAEENAKLPFSQRMLSREVVVTSILVVLLGSIALAMLLHQPK
jgi:hypothetical protein